VIELNAIRWGGFFAQHGSAGVTQCPGKEKGDYQDPKQDWYAG
jgi:hypothetical protein